MKKILTQKSRFQWVKEGEENKKFFHASVQNRLSSNKIDFLVDEIGSLVKDYKKIESMILSFYQDLLGSSTATLEGVDHVLFLFGSLMSSN